MFTVLWSFVSRSKVHSCSQEKASDTARQREAGLFNGLTTTDRTLARFVKTLALFEDKPALLALGRLNAKWLPLLLKAASNVLQMIVDLFFRQADRHRQILGGNRLSLQQRNDLLAQSGGLFNRNRRPMGSSDSHLKYPFSYSNTLTSSRF